VPPEQSLPGPAAARENDGRREAQYSGIEILEVVAEAHNYNAWLAGLVRHGLGTARSVLDFGAGSGTFASLLRREGLELRCVEPDDTLAGRLRADGFDVIASPDTLPADACPAAYSLNVIEHIEDDTAALRGLYRVIRPQGRLVLYVPAFPILFSSFDTRFGHHRRYRRGILKARVEVAGFRVLDCRYVDCLGFFAALAFKILDRGTGDVSRFSIMAYDRVVFPLSRRLDAILGRWFGKNLYLIAVKD
jgi:SAM-dependent methyltransferase